MPVDFDVLGRLVAVATVDREGRFTEVSDQWCALAGWTREALLGEHWSIALHVDDVEKALAYRDDYLANGQAPNYEVRVVSPDREHWKIVQSHVLPTSGADGEVTGWMVVAFDRTDQKQVEAALELSERQLQLIFAYSTDVVTVFEADGRLRLTTLGSQWDRAGSTEDLKMGSWWAAIHPDDRERVEQAFADLVANRDGAAGRLIELRLVRADGSVQWVETVGSNLVDEPSVGGIVLHTRDVSERRTARDELRMVSTRLMALINGLHLGVHIIDESGTIVGVNRAFLDTLAVDEEPAELVGKDALQALLRLREIWQDPTATTTKLMEMSSDRIAVRGSQLGLVDGRTVAMDYIPIMTEGSFLGHVWLIRDITDDVALIAEREHLLEIARKQNAHLVELDALKTGLISSVSHELRTPLTSIVSFTQLLREGIGADTDDAQVEYVDIISRNVERLQRMVDDLLFLDRVESKGVDLSVESVDFPNVVAMAVSSIHPMAKERGIDVDLAIDEGPILRGDPDRLGQMVDNLLSNAVRYTRNHGRVSVRSWCDADGWHLEVADTGIGIPPEERDKIFERFFRATNARQHESAGSGLGLAIVRHVVELHDGTIEVAGNADGGATFSVTVCGLDDSAKHPAHRSRLRATARR
jgi:PAS domain S-box-containing protein